MSNKIATLLRNVMAATQNVSMEDASAEQGELSEAELKKVNDQAAAEEAAPVTDAPVEEPAPETATDDNPIPEGEAADAPVAEEGAATELGDEPPADLGGDAPTDDTEEVAVDEIQTPAEEELQTLSEENPEAGAEAEAVVEAGEEAAEAAAGIEGEPEIADVPADGADAGLDAAGPEGLDAGAEAPLDDAGVVADPAAADAAVDAPIEGDVTADPTAEVPATDAPIDTPVEGDAAPAPESATPASGEEEGAEGEQQQAAPPGEDTDTSEAVAEVVEVVEAAASARSASDVLKQVQGLSETASDLNETTEFLNESAGGVTVESFALIEMTARSMTNLMERDPINFGISLESFTEPGQRLEVSLEELQDLIAELDLSSTDVERQAIEAIDRMVKGLKDALPSTFDRLQDVLSLAGATDDTREGGAVKVDDGIAGALGCEGVMPEDLANELQQYAAVGEQLLTVYQEAAVRAARGASMLNNALDFSSLTSFWEKIGKVVDGVTDPRNNLSRTQIERPLPGGSSLFGDPSPLREVPNATLQALFEYNSNYPPLESMISRKGAGSEGATYPAISASKITLVGKALGNLLCMDRIDALLEEGSKLWPEARDTTRHLRETLENAPQEITSTVGPDFSQLIKYVDTNYSLATWPLLNYLSNLLITANAFVLFADRSLKAQPAETQEPVEEVGTAIPVPEEPAPTIDPVAAETPAEGVETIEPLDTAGEIPDVADAGLDEPAAEPASTEDAAGAEPTPEETPDADGAEPAAEPVVEDEEEEEKKPDADGDIPDMPNL